MNRLPPSEAAHRHSKDGQNDVVSPYFTMRTLAATLLITLVAIAAASLSSKAYPEPKQQDPLTDGLASREFFYVGGQYVNASLVCCPVLHQIYTPARLTCIGRRFARSIHARSDLRRATRPAGGKTQAPCGLHSRSRADGDSMLLLCSL